MQNIYDTSAELEQIAKEQYAIPPYLMMEHAAEEMKRFILNLSVIKDKIAEKRLPDVLVVCGKGNNGGDGLALARLLQGKVKVTIISPEDPVTEESITQYKMCKRLGIRIISSLEDYAYNPQVVVDALIGTGFHGNLTPQYEELISKLNSMDTIRIACDVPSGFLFCADYTITMGVHKMALFSDAAKSVCGEIFVADLGIQKSRFEEPVAQDLLNEDTVALMPFPSAYLIEKNDVILPLRSDASSHKGDYGHTVVYVGKKAGAGILAATSAMNFGSGLTSIIKTENSNLDSFKISPELMLADKLPEKTTCIVLGPGLGLSEEGTIVDESISDLMEWFKTAPNPACVLDADMFHFVELQSLLEELNEVEGGRIVLTPHLKEYELLIDKVPKLSSMKNVTVVRKSANTFITSEGNVYVVSDGTQNLAKGGSGDVLAGMIGALLSQGYSSKDAAITACEVHAMASADYGAEAYDFSPEKLISIINK